MKRKISPVGRQQELAANAGGGGSRLKTRVLGRWLVVEIVTTRVKHRGSVIQSGRTPKWKQRDEGDSPGKT